MTVTGSVLWTSSRGGAGFEFWAPFGGSILEILPKVHLSGFHYLINTRVRQMRLVTTYIIKFHNYISNKFQVHQDKLYTIKNCHTYTYCV